MPSTAKPMAPKSFPNLKKKLSTLVQETSFRAFARKSTKSTPDARPQAAARDLPAAANIVPAKARDSLLDDTVLGDFKPFDIDLSILDSFRLPENCIDGQRQDQPSSTPIADDFARNASQTDEHDQFGPNPVRTESALLGRLSTDAKISRAETRSVQTQDTPSDQLTEAGPSRTCVVQSQSASSSETTKIPPKHQVKAVSLLKPVGSSEHPTTRNLTETVERLNSSKRHSMPPSIPSELVNRRSVADTKESLAHRSVSSPQERRLSLQPASPAAAVPPASPSAQTLLSRTSTRLSDRLAWIRELEEGKNISANPGRDFVLKNVQGGVADKLAKFEGKQLNGSLTRTNSSISRVSSVDAFGIESSQVSIKSRASTVDTSNRASSVFTNFDESFRGRMEMLAGTLADRTQEESSGKEKSPSKITSKFIPVTGSSETTIVPQEVIDFATLCKDNSESAINDVANHRNLGSTPSWNGSNALQQRSNAANGALTERPLSHVNKRPSSTEKQSRPAPIIPIQAEPPPPKPKPSNAYPEVASSPPAVPTRAVIDANSAPSIKEIPLATDEQRHNQAKSEGGVEKVESPTTSRFNPAALPLFVPA